MTWIGVLAVLLSPVIAVLVTLWHQSRKEKRDAKRWIVQTLMATRHSRLTDEAVRALNLIDLVFHDAPTVRRLWHEYFEMLCNEGLNNLQGGNTRSKKSLEMLTEMARVVGYGSSVTHLDVDRVYFPQALGDQEQRTREISDELLRVLKGSQGLQIQPRLEAPPNSGEPPLLR